MEITFEDFTLIFLRSRRLFLETLVLFFGLSHLHIFGTDLKEIVDSLLGLLSFRFIHEFFDIASSVFIFILYLTLCFIFLFVFG